MAHLLVFALENLEECPAVLEAWDKAGAGELTVLEGHVLAKQGESRRDDVGLLPSLRDILAGTEAHRRLVMALIEDQATLDKVIQVTEGMVKECECSGGGLLFVLPVTRTLRLEPPGPEDR